MKKAAEALVTEAEAASEEDKQAGEGSASEEANPSAEPAASPPTIYKEVKKTTTQLK